MNNFKITNKKVVFFDLDGTLLDDNKKILESSKIAIEKLKKNNVIPVVATGRPPSNIQWILKELNINSYITINGQHAVYEGKEIYKIPFEQEFLSELTKLTSNKKDALVYGSLYEVKSSVVGHPYIREIYENLGKMSYPSFEEGFHNNNPIFKLILFCESSNENFYSEKFQAMRFSRWHKYAIDIIPLGISKAEGISKFLELTGIPKENTYAFGDELNDMEMFSVVGTSVAMGNAVMELKNISHYITTTNNEDGILNGLIKVGLI